jgi:hypothetical protein
VHVTLSPKKICLRGQNLCVFFKHIRYQFENPWPYGIQKNAGVHKSSVSVRQTKCASILALYIGLCVCDLSTPYMFIISSTSWAPTTLHSEWFFLVEYVLFFIFVEKKKKKKKTLETFGLHCEMCFSSKKKPHYQN